MPPRTLILGTAGHIDHGKTALVHALTGIDTDRLPQEKERGITIDIGFAHLELENAYLGIVDVPGHERFIRNMLAGAAGIDLALLVVAADDSVMPQTREHLAILELLGVPRGVIALTKCDLVEPDWLGIVEEDVRDLVRGTLLADAAIVRTSATTGAGIDDLKEALAAACGQAAEAETDVPFRLAVDRSFVQRGVGTVVTGTVYSGAIAKGDTVDWLPAGRLVRVRGLQSHGRVVERVSRGQRAAVNLSDVHHTEIVRGHEIAAPGYLVPSRVLTVRLRVLPESPWPVRHRARLRLHAGTQEVMVRVGLLAGTTIEPGAVADAQLFADGPAVTVAGQPFVVRAESPLVTLGGGHVLQPVARRIGRRDATAREHVARLGDRDPLARVAAALRLNRAGAFTELEAMRLTGLGREAVARALSELAADGTMVTLEAGRTIRLHRDELAAIESRVLAVLGRLHEAAPLEPVVSRSRVAAAFARRDEPALIDAVIDRLVAAGRVRGDDRGIARADFAPRLSESQTRLRAGVVESFRAAGFSPPDLAGLSAETGADEGELRAILDLVTHAGELVHLGGGLYVHAETERELRRRLVGGLGAEGGMTMSAIRDILGTSRKYALPMCEYLDRIGLTKRVDDRRVLRG